MRESESCYKLRNSINMKHYNINSSNVEIEFYIINLMNKNL